MKNQGSGFHLVRFISLASYFLEILSFFHLLTRPAAFSSLRYSILGLAGLIDFVVSYYFIIIFSLPTGNVSYHFDMKRNIMMKKCMLYIFLAE